VKRAQPFPDVSASRVPWITTEQMIEVDRAMIEDFGIDLAKMMENAGRCLAIVAARRFLDQVAGAKSAWVLAGTGGNGGGALVAARRLAAWGVDVAVWTTRPAARFSEVPGHQLRILQRMGMAVSSTGMPPDATRPDVIVDGLIGYSLRGAPRGRAAELIDAANQSAAPVLSLDVPSGVAASSGEIFTPSIHATATVTLALPKAGLRASSVAAQVGELYLADISVPPTLYRSERLRLEVASPFAAGDILRVVAEE
jgi:NAD(P)H-hydrate epimerase